MIVQLWQIIVLMGVVGLLVLAGVLVGAWFVFRAKESHGSLFASPKGDAFNLDDGGPPGILDAFKPRDTEEVLAEMPDVLRRSNVAFSGQFSPQGDDGDGLIDPESLKAREEAERQERMKYERAS